MFVADVIFWLLSLTAIIAALGVVLVRDLFRSVLLLAVVFICVGGFFVLMSAEFLAVVQILIYVGAISILFVFAIMLTRDVRRGNSPNKLQIPAVFISTLVLAALVVVAIGTEWNKIPAEDKSVVDMVQINAITAMTKEDLLDVDKSLSESNEEPVGLADLLIGKFVLPFEAVSLLLLATLIGGLALARRQEGG